MAYAEAKAGRLLARPGKPTVEAAPTRGVQKLGFGGHRDGLLYVPESYRADRPAPLVVMLHGAGGHADHALQPLLKLADEAGLILLAPDSRGPTWDVILDEYGPDVAFIDQALAYVFARYAVDPARVAVEGFSDGASYALSLGVANGDLFPHVIAFSPGFAVPSGQQGAPRFYISHGTGDTVLPIDPCSRKLVPRLQRAGYSVRYHEFEGGHGVPGDIAREALDWFTAAPQSESCVPPGAAHTRRPVAPQPEAAVSTQERTHRWRQLLSYQRLGLKERSERAPSESHEPEHRTDYDKDYDRIVFSSAFRRLHDKTQVFPLSTSDYTRTRLTHSIEASCVGRSLGQLAGQRLRQQGVRDVDPANLGTIVAAACLAHDIGNPPFGHSGEAAIQHWAERRWPEERGRPAVFGSDAEWRDVLRFEGNAQGFRILNRLQSRDQEGGLRYTVATLGAMSKYPCPSHSEGWAPDPKRISQKKFGYFQDDSKLAREAFGALGLRERAPGVYARHPLAFLVEAADDICYAVIDLEDSVELKLIAPEEACSMLEAIAPSSRRSTEPQRLERWQWEAKLSRARSRAIGELIHQCVEVFAESVEKMEAGEWEQSLVDVRPDVRSALKAIKGLTREKGYQSERVLQIESAGFKTLGGLLDMFADAVMADRPNKQEAKLRQLLPLEYVQRPEHLCENRDRAIERLSAYQRLLCVTDYISGMTDGFAVELYQRLSGIKLPT